MGHRSFLGAFGIPQRADRAGKTLAHGGGGKPQQLADLEGGETVSIPEHEELADLRGEGYQLLARDADLLAAEQLGEGRSGLDELRGCLLERDTAPLCAQVVEHEIPGDGEGERQRASSLLVERFEAGGGPPKGGGAKAPGSPRRRAPAPA